MERQDMDLDFEDEDFEFSHQGEGDQNRFDTIVGRLEDLVMSEDFLQLKDDFMARYSHEFSDAEQNKLIYTQIFQQYLSTIQQYIQDQLSDIDLAQFCSMIQDRQNQIDGPLFQMLLSFSDFQVFKQMMTKLPDQLQLTGAQAIIHTDQVEDGEIRPDLDDWFIKS